MRLVVLHPWAGRKSRRAYGDALLRALEADNERAELLETVAGADNAARIAARLARGDVRSLVVAGGDGTVRDAVEAMLALEPGRRPALLAVALGTANNAARAFGGFVATPRGVSGVDAVMACLRRGATRRADAATANGHVFAGSFAAGMDADILAWRNATAQRVPAAFAGYPLYLAACVFAATRRHGEALRLVLDDGEAQRGHGFNVLVTNTALYAGEFRFAAGCRHDDGLLDVLWNARVGDYLRCYAAAWPRHLRIGAGLAAADDRRLQSAARIALEFERPVQWQLDGEAMGRAAQFAIAVEAGALDVLGP